MDSTLNEASVAGPGSTSEAKHSLKAWHQARTRGRRRQALPVRRIRNRKAATFLGPIKDQIPSTKRPNEGTWAAGPPPAVWVKIVARQTTFPLRVRTRLHFPEGERV
jgi:hypothetical protein